MGFIGIAPPRGTSTQTSPRSSFARIAPAVVKRPNTTERGYSPSRRWVRFSESAGQLGRKDSTVSTLL